MASRTIKSVKGRVMRLTRLDECGLPAIGECSTIVTSGFVSVTLSDEVESGEEYTQKNAWGDFCVAEKDADRRKWVNVAISMCEVDPEVLDLVGGANPVTDTNGDIIGVTFGREPNPNAFAIEVWTKKAGGDACAPGGGAQEWGYFAVPNVRNGSLDGDITIENGPLTLGLKGEGGGANGWGSGPYGDMPLGPIGFPDGELYGMGITTAQPPDPTDGCQSLDVISPPRGSASPGDVFPADPDITASDPTNAAKLAGEGFVASPTTGWGTTEKMTVGTFDFYWDGTAWQPGAAP